MVKFLLLPVTVLLLLCVGAQSIDAQPSVSRSACSTTVTSITATFCVNQSYNFNGVNLNQAGTYTDTLQSVDGCDSIIILHLSTRPVSNTDIYPVVCYGQSFTHNELHYYDSGDYVETLTNIYGCDSNVHIHLTVLPQYSSSIQATVCSGVPFVYNGISYTAAGNYDVYFQSTTGCDSVVTLHISTGITDSINQSVALCPNDSVYFYGRWLKSAGTYDTVFHGHNTCDTIVKLRVILTAQLPPTHITANICSSDSFNFNGNYLHHSGTYTTNFTPQAGCDSIVTLNLTVHSPIVSHKTVTVCDGSGYVFNGVLLTVGGNYSAIFQTSYGCDSTVILHLNIGADTIQLTEKLCPNDSLYFYGRWIKAPGSYEVLVPGIAACDTFYYLNLIPGTPVPPTYLNFALCTGDSLFYNNTYFKTPGTYTFNLNPQSGCDSLVILNISLNPLPNVSLSWESLLQSSYLSTYNGDTVYCLAAGASRFQLTGGFPPGGIYSGLGISNNAVVTDSLLAAIIAHGTQGIDTITYTYTDGNGCHQTAINQLLVLLCNDVPELPATHLIDFYPNPANNTLFIKADFRQPQLLRLLDMRYQLLQQTGFKYEMDISHLAAGLYFIEAVDGDRTERNRFVKF